MSTQITEDTDTIEAFDFQTACGTTVANYNPHTGKLSNPSEPCPNPAKWIVTKHRPTKDCSEVEDLACEEHYQMFRNTNCPHCGRQIHRNGRRLP